MWIVVLASVLDYHADITAQADEVRNALRAKLNTLGSDLSKGVAWSGRLLPKKRSKQAPVIVKAQGVGGNPKLMRRIDMGASNTAHSDITTFLAAIDVQECRKIRVLRWLSGMAFNLILIANYFVIWFWCSGNL